MGDANGVTQYTTMATYVFFYKLQTLIWNVKFCNCKLAVFLFDCPLKLSTVANPGSWLCFTFSVATAGPKERGKYRLAYVSVCDVGISSHSLFLAAFPIQESKSLKSGSYEICNIIETETRFQKHSGIQCTLTRIYNQQNSCYATVFCAKTVSQRTNKQQLNNADERYTCSKQHQYTHHKDQVEGKQQILHTFHSTLNHFGRF